MLSKTHELLKHDFIGANDSIIDICMAEDTEESKKDQKQEVSSTQAEPSALPDEKQQGKLFWDTAGRTEYDPPEPRSMDLDNMGEALTAAQQQQLDQLLDEFSSVFSHHRWDIGEIDRSFGELVVELKEGKTIQYGSRMPKTSFQEEQWLKEDTDKMVAAGVIRPTVAKGGCYMRHVPKPDNTNRAIVNFQPVNEATKSEMYHIGDCEKALFRMKKPKYFTALDQTQSFYALQVKTTDGYDADHIWRKYVPLYMLTPAGVFEYLRAPMGYQGSPSAFARTMQNILNTLPVDEATGEPFAKAFVDDLLIHSTDWESHIKHLRMVLQVLKDANCRLRFSKCEFAKRQVRYLGYRINEHGVSIDSDKLDPILRLAPPPNSASLKSFLATCAFFSGHIQNFSAITVPLRKRLTVEEGKKPWSPEQMTAFETLKTALTSAPILARPDFTLPFCVACDWSQTAFGAYLYQLCPKTGNQRVIRYASRLCTPVEQKLAPTIGEAACVVWALHKFRSYIFGLPGLVVYTDHAALQYLMNSKSQSNQPKLARWASKLDEYGAFEIRHRPGKENLIPDCLSRNPIYSPEENALNSMLEILMLGAAQDDEQTTCSDIYGESMEHIFAQQDAATQPAAVADATENMTARQIDKTLACDVCGHTDGENSMLCCDKCGKYVHTTCMMRGYIPAAASFVCGKCDPTYDSAMAAYFTPDTTYTYDRRDPYLDTEMLDHLAYIKRHNMASPVAKRAVKIRFHPSLPGWLQQRFHSGTPDNVWRTIPPKEYRAAIMQEAHADMGHAGRRLTIQHLKNGGYTWRGLTKDVKVMVRTCTECQRADAQLQVPRTVSPVDTHMPNKRWAVDLCGPFTYTPPSTQECPEPATRSYYIFVGVECFSRYCELQIIPDKTPASAARAFYESIVCRHGIPKEVQSDRGHEWLTLEFRDMLTSLRIYHAKTSPGNPAANGIAENRVKALKRCLATLSENHKSGWPRHVPRVQYILNTKRHHTTNYTPYYLMYGRDPNNKGDLSRYIVSPAPERQELGIYHAGVYAVKEDYTKEERKYISEIVRDNLAKAEGEVYLRTQKRQDSNARHRQDKYNRIARAKVATGRVETIPQPGDPVLLMNPSQFAGKKAHSKGPFYYEKLDERTGMAILQTGNTRDKESQRFLARLDRLVKFRWKTR